MYAISYFGGLIPRRYGSDILGACHLGHGRRGKPRLDRFVGGLRASTKAAASRRTPRWAQRRTLRCELAERWRSEDRRYNCNVKIKDDIKGWSCVLRLTRLGDGRLLGWGRGVTLERGDDYQPRE